MDQHLRRALARMSAVRQPMTANPAIRDVPDVNHQLDAIAGQLLTFKRRRVSGPQPADTHLESALRLLESLKKDINASRGDLHEYRGEYRGEYRELGGEG